MYYGGGNVTVINNRSRPLPYDFVSLTLKGRTDGFVLKGGDATSGKQTTMFDGPRPFETAAGLATTDLLSSKKGHQKTAFFIRPCACVCKHRTADGDSVGARNRGVGATISLQKCTHGNSKQIWAFANDRKSIGSGGRCLDIVSHFRSRPTFCSQIRLDTQQAQRAASSLFHHSSGLSWICHRTTTKLARGRRSGRFPAASTAAAMNSGSLGYRLGMGKYGLGFIKTCFLLVLDFLKQNTHQKTSTRN